MKNHKSKIINPSNRLRVVIFRSNRYICASLVNIKTDQTVCSLSSKKVKAKGKPVELAFEVGTILAKQIIAKKITNVVFDRRNYRYHGQVKALAEGLRKGGLKF